MRLAWRIAVAGLCLTGVVTCTSGEADPSVGVYIVAFPSTAAAIATDTVQLLVFDVKSPADRGDICDKLIDARLTGGALTPTVPPAPAANICEMRAGRKPVTIPYGEHALLAIAQKRDRQDQFQDFLIGCAVMIVGKGDAPLPIPVRLISVDQPVPATTCGSVGEFCEDRCSTL